MTVRYYPGTHRPDGPRAPIHDVGCPGAGMHLGNRTDVGCGGTFRCSRCRRTVGWCFGMDGDSLCNNCPPKKETR